MVSGLPPRWEARREPCELRERSKQLLALYGRLVQGTLLNVAKKRISHQVIQAVTKRKELIGQLIVTEGEYWETDPTASAISGFQQQIAGKLALDVEVPLLHV